MGVSEDLDKAIELLNSRQPPESYILVCSPEMAAMIEQFGGLPEHVTLQKSPYCDLDKAYLVKDEKRCADRIGVCGMGVIIPLGIWCLVGFIIFMKNTSKTERQTFIDDFNHANIPEKMFIVFLMFCILILHPIAKICEILEGK